MKILEETKNGFLIFAGKVLRLTRKNAFEGVFQQKQIWHFGKLLTQKCYTKTYKILKNLFRFDHQAIEYTHITFEHVQSHK